MAFSITIGGMTFTEANFEGSAYAQEATGFAKALEKVVQHVADSFRGEASDVLTVGVGSKALTILNASGQVPAFGIGMPVRIARTSDPSNTYMQGELTAWDGSTGAATVNVTATGGAGTFSDWTVTVGGMIATVTGSPVVVADGGTGATTAAGARINLEVSDAVVAKSAGYTVALADHGKFHTQNGTYVVGLLAAASAGDGFHLTIINVGAGTITIDPNAAETINGAGTLVLSDQYDGVRLVCDGSAWVATVASGDLPTKEFNVHPTDEAGNTMASSGDWRLFNVNAANNLFFTFKVPHDFNSLISAQLISIPDSTESIQWDTAVSFGAAGEAKNANTDAQINMSLSVAINKIQQMDIDDSFTGLAADDYVALKVTSDTTVIRLAMLRIRYA